MALKYEGNKQAQDRAKIDLARIREHKETLLKASIDYFEPDDAYDNMDEELKTAIAVIKERTKSLVFATPTTKTPKGLGIMSIEYGLDGIWISNGRLVCHIDADVMPKTTMLDKYGNELQRNY